MTDSRLSLRQQFFDANVEALTIEANTRERLESAACEGEWIALPDGDPVILYRGDVLGAPPDDASAARTHANIASNPCGVVVVFGLGAGHTARQIRDRTDGAVVVVEPNAGILRTVLERGPCDLGGTRVVTDLNDLRVNWAGLARGRSLATLVVTPGYQHAFPVELQELTTAVSDLVEKVQINENTYSTRSRTWLDDVMENVEALVGAVPLLALTGRYPNVPAFVVGAGPSLNHNGHLLQEAARKGIVFAVDVAGKICAHHGAEPQVLVTIESIDLSREVLGLPWIDRVVRAFSMLSSPAVVRAGGGPWLPFHEHLVEFDALTALLKVPAVMVGGSVSTAAYSIANLFGCSPIVLLGQDLAYPRGETYAKGCSYAGSRAKRADDDPRRLTVEWSKEAQLAHGTSAGPLPSSSALREVQAWGGEGTVPTTESFNAFRSWFELMAEASRRARADLRLVNASEGGSRIRGFQELTLASVLRDLPMLDITSADLAAEARRLRPPMAAGDVQQWARRQARLSRGVAVAARRLRKAARAAIDAVSGEDPARINRSFHVLGQAEARLARASSQQHLPEAWACRALQHVTTLQRDRLACGDAQANARASLQAEYDMTEIVRRAACDLETRLHSLANRCGSEAAPRMEKVGCL